MGYRLKERTFRLTFEGTDWEGLEVVCRPPSSLEQLLSFQALGTRLQAGGELVELLTMLRELGDQALVSWNLEDGEGAPYPATGAGLAKLPDAPLALEIVKRWVEATVTVPAPLGVPSRNGGGSPEASVPMEAL